MEKRSYVYILASQRNGTLYIGVTTDLVKRIHSHRTGAVSGFTKEYAVKMLVYFECHVCIENAISREKAMKKWYRKWKFKLIEKDNPEWRGL